MQSHFVETFWSFRRLFTVFVRWDQKSLSCFCPMREECPSESSVQCPGCYWVFPSWPVATWIIPTPVWAPQELLYLFLSGGSALSFRSFLHMHALISTCLRIWERNSVWTYGMFSLCSPLFAATLLWVLAILTSLNCQLDLNPRRLSSYLGSSS